MFQSRKLKAEIDSLKEATTSMQENMKIAEKKNEELIKQVNKFKNEAKKLQEKNASLIKKSKKNPYQKHILTPQEKAKAWKGVFQKDCTDFKMVMKKGTAMDSVDASSVAMDSLATQGFKANFSVNYGLDPLFYEYYAKYGFIGYQACAMLMNHWFIARACTLPVEEAIAAGYDLVLKNEEDRDRQENVDILKQAKYIADKKYALDKAIKGFGVNNRTFGVAYALPVIDGVDLEAPFNIDGVKKGSYKGIKIVEPMWILPEFNQSSLLVPSDLRFYEPEYYKLMNGTRIHRSHFEKIIFSPVADILKPSYFFGGVPLTQMLYRPTYSAETIADELSQLVRSKRLLVVDGDMEGFIANQEEMETVLEAFTYARDNHSVAMKNPDGEITSLDVSLNDLPEVMVKAYQRASAIAGIPYERMMAANPIGSNASGEYTTKNYVQLLDSIRELQLKKLYLRHYKLSLKSDFGKNFECDIQFKAIDAPTRIEKSQDDAIRVNTLSTALQNGAISADEMRDALMSFTDLNLNNNKDDLSYQDMQQELRVQKGIEPPTASKTHLLNPMRGSGKSFNPMSDPERSTLPVSPTERVKEGTKVRGFSAVPTSLNATKEH